MTQTKPVLVDLRSSQRIHLEEGPTASSCHIVFFIGTPHLLGSQHLFVLLSIAHGRSYNDVHRSLTLRGDSVPRSKEVFWQGAEVATDALVCLTRQLARQVWPRRRISLCQPRCPAIHRGWKENAARCVALLRKREQTSIEAGWVMMKVSAHSGGQRGDARGIRLSRQPSL